MFVKKSVVAVGVLLAIATFVTPLSVVLCAAPQESKSAPLVKELARLLDASRLDSIAAPDPETGNYVAALYFPGAQLLVISGKFGDTFLGPHRMSKREYREMYMDLQGASVVGSRLFAQDAGANGFVVKPIGGTAADTYERENKTTVFDGAWKKAKISAQDYAKSFSDADEHYARVLALLVAQAKQKTGS